MARELTVLLKDQPGSLAEFNAVLVDANLEVIGYSGYSREDHGVVHLLVTEIETARAALERSGFQVRGDREVYLSKMGNDLAAGATLWRRIADSGANVDLFYFTGDGRLVIGVDRIDLVREALGYESA